MRSTRAFFYDSYKSARGSLDPLFSTFCSPAQAQKRVRSFILTQSRHLQRLSKVQQRSWVRANVSLVLQESRRHKNYAVAEAALRVAFTEKEWVDTVDAVWVKDAAASCRSVEELRDLQKLLATFPAQMAGLQNGAREANGNLLSVLLGGSGRGDLGAHEAQLGDGNVKAALAVLDEEQTSNAVASPPSRAGGADPESREALLAQLSPEQTVALALATSTVEAAGGGETSARSQMERAAAAMRRLEDCREAAVVAPNHSFAKYFLRQGIVRTESELMALVQAMRSRPEEIGFRVHLSHPHGEAAVQLLTGRGGIGPVSWLPSSLGAFTLDCTNASAIHSNRTLLRALATERVISFQSKSSMLPVFFLNPQPGERVLDLCASPGSKTTQILDLMADTSLLPTPTAAARRGGCVCANEWNDERARELVSRLQNYSTETVVTRAHGEWFGASAWQDRLTPGGRSGHRHEARHPASVGDASVDNYFDKVLVDAPCSGEGRMGRDVMAWRMWHPGHGVSFFPRQVRLLLRAVAVCRPGGTIVYATCTMNPLENEAVVAAVLRECGNAIELVMPPPLNPLAGTSGVALSGSPLAAAAGAEWDQVARPLVLDHGLSSWSVPSAAGGFYDSAAEALTQEGEPARLPPALFPPVDEETTDRSLRLGEQLSQRCRRVLPHRNGAGAEGFFVAILRKVKPTLPLTYQAGALPYSHSPPLPPPPSSSLLHARGFLRIPASHQTVQQLLQPFCAAPVASPDPIALIMNKSASRGGSVLRLLSEMGCVPLWKEDEGLRLTSSAACEVTKVLSTGDGLPTGGASFRPGTAGKNGSEGACNAATRLLDMGVLAFDRTGQLTERGASLLRPHARSRVIGLPPLHVQLLLANRQLDITGAEAGDGVGPDAVTAALHYTSNGLASKASGSVSTGWTTQVMDELSGHGSGNAIVVVKTDDSSSQKTALTRSSRGNDRADQWASFASAWTFPVRAEVLATPAGATGVPPNLTVRLHLLLSREARQRATAMIGRLHGHERWRPTEKGMREYLQNSKGLATSGVMATRELFGTDAVASKQQQGLLGSQVNRPAHRDGSTQRGHDADSDVFEF